MLQDARQLNQLPDGRVVFPFRQLVLDDRLPSRQIGIPVLTGRRLEPFEGFVVLEMLQQHQPVGIIEPRIVAAETACRLHVRGGVVQTGSASLITALEHVPQPLDVLGSLGVRRETRQRRICRFHLRRLCMDSIRCGLCRLDGDCREVDLFVLTRRCRLPSVRIVLWHRRGLGLSLRIRLWQRRRLFSGGPHSHDFRSGGTFFLIGIGLVCA